MTKRELHAADVAVAKQRIAEFQDGRLNRLNSLLSIVGLLESSQIEEVIVFAEELRNGSGKLPKPVKAPKPRAKKPKTKKAA